MADIVVEEQESQVLPLYLDPLKDPISIKVAMESKLLLSQAQAITTPEEVEEGTVQIIMD